MVTVNKEKHHFIITVRHLLIPRLWFIHDEFDGTDDDCVGYMTKKEPKDYKIIKGNWCELQHQVNVEEKNEIFKKHSQGGVFDEKQDAQNSV